jgi:cyclin-dependent kinase 7
MSGIQNYSKSKKLGEGTYAVVYLGTQLSTNREVAIKEIKTEGFKDGLDMSAIREVKYLQELKHKNIIELIDVFSDSQQNLNLVLEVLPGDLEKVLRDKNIVIGGVDVKRWLLMILRGVYHCHRNGILHRDLKPNNLLMDPSGNLKIADFGLARSLDQPNEKLTSNVVTRWYRSPELLFGARHYTAAVDVWAVGAIFAEMMLRTPYLPGSDDANQLAVTIQALGTPTEDTWEGVSHLPLYNNLTIYPAPTRGELRRRFVAASENSLIVLEGMMTMNPRKRWTCEEALLSGYFIEEPIP